MKRLVRLLEKTTENLPKEKTLEEMFDNIAKELIFYHLITTPKGLCKIQEIEFYYHSVDHPDPYVHKNKRQLEFCNWYFHRFKEVDSFLKFSRNGVDITFGNKNKDIYGGILIRKIFNIDTKEKIKGINHVVKYLISDISKEEITKLATENINIFDDNYPLFLKGTKKENFHKLNKAIRNGLSIKDNLLHKEYYNKKYCYFVDIFSEDSFYNF